MRINRLIFTLSSGLLLAACSQSESPSGKTHGTESTIECAASETGAAVIVMDAWVAAADASRPTTAVYLTLCNSGSSTDALTDASFAGAEAVEVHQTTVDESGLAGMAPVANLALPAGEQVRLEHGGAHIMLIGLKDDLVAGSEQKITLNFEKAGPLEISLDVRDTTQHSEH